MRLLPAPPNRGLGRTMRIILVAAGILGCLIGGTTQARDEPPKLVVAIAVDQLSANLFEEWRPRFRHGLKRLASGIVYPSGYQSHAATETCPGHSTLLTGRHPNKTGIVGNTMRDERTGASVYCLQDSSVVLAHDKAASPVGPRRLMVDTLGEWLKAASPASRVVAVSGKDRGAITMAGHRPDGVFWLAPGYGFTTYADPSADPAAALAPVADLNRKIAGNWQHPPAWSYTHPDCRAAESNWTISGKPFASRLPPEGSTGLRGMMQSPLNDEMTLAAAQHLVEHFKLGRGPATDLLTVSFSGTDAIGHAYGSRGPEMCEQMYRLDAAIGKLLTDLDRLKVSYLVVLSADHGGSDHAERLAQQGYPARRVDGSAILKRLNEAVMAKTGTTAPPFTGSIDEPALAPAIAPADRDRVLAAAKQALATESDVAEVFTLDEVLATEIPRGKAPDELTLRERFAESAYRGRSGDLLVALQPYVSSPGMPGAYVAGHGSPWNYDRRVPIVFWWNGAPAETRYLPIETVDIAPTLAAVLRLVAPADVDGRCRPVTNPSACSVR